MMIYKLLSKITRKIQNISTFFISGYPFYSGQSEFRFEMNLSYRLRPILEEYGNYKPSLVFCNSRKATVHTATVLSQVQPTNN